MTAQTQPRARDGAAPWIVAGVLAALVAVLVLMLVRVHTVSGDNARTAGSRLVAPTAPQQRAVDAASAEAVNLTTLSRANFEKDFDRALAGTTGQLRSDLVKHKSAYLSAMTAGKFDLKSAVVQAGYAGTSGGAVQVLVTLNGTHVVSGAAGSVPTPQRLELTMVHDGKSASWLASGFISVGIQ